MHVPLKEETLEQANLYRRVSQGPPASLIGLTHDLPYPNA